MTPRCWAGETEWMVGPLSDLSLSLFLSDTSGGGLIAKSCPTLATLLRVPMGFSRGVYWSGLPFPSPQILVVLNNVALLFIIYKI